MRINPVTIRPVAQVSKQPGQPIQFGTYVYGDYERPLYVAQNKEAAERTNKLTAAVEQLNTTLNTRLGELIQVLKPVNPPYKDV